MFADKSCRSCLGALAVVASALFPAFAKETVPTVYEARLLYVAPHGDDAASGDKSHPLQTPEGARDRIRAWRTANGGTLPCGGTIVTFADGEYVLTRPLIFSDVDSGTPESPVVYRAANVGKAVLCGYVEPKWKRDGDRLTADVPDGLDLPRLFSASEYLQSELLPQDGNPWTVVADGERLGLAQWPRQDVAWTCLDGLKTVRRDFTCVSKGKVFSLRDADGRAPADIRLASEPELWAQGDWRSTYSDMTLPVVGQDQTKGTFTLETPDDFPVILADNPVRLLNVHAELVPGTWAFDRARRRLFAMPKRPEARPRLGAVDTLVVATNVTDVVFRGFVLEGARRAAVDLTSCRDVELVGLTVRHVSGWGVWITGGRHCRVAGCDLYGLGRGGVWAEGGTLDTLTPAEHVVDNCHVHDYAWRVWNYNPGVALVGVGNRATHNLVHHSTHQAFSHYGALHRFEANIVHDVCTMTDDAGAIYGYNTAHAWSHRGNAIVGNVFHAIGPKRPRWCQTDGIYIDAFTSGTVVEDNIVNDASFGIFSSGGQDNRIRRNLVLRTHKAGIRRWNLGLRGGTRKFHHVIDGYTNDCDRASYLMKPLVDKNDLYTMDFWRERFPNMLRPLELPNAAYAHDALYCEITSNVLADAVGVSVADEAFTREHTVVNGNVVLEDDPGLVDYLGLDWRLKPDSPVRTVLGGDTAFAAAGLYDSVERASPAVKWGADVKRPEPFPTVPFVADIRPQVDESQPITRLRFPRDVKAFGWTHRRGDDITNTLTIAWMYPRIRRIYLAPDAGLSDAALAEAKKTLAEWTDGRAEILEGKNQGK